MPARIEIVSGPDAGQRIEIESPVVSIGGAPDRDLRLEGEVDSVATVRFREGKYTVFNRSDQALDVGGQVVSPEGMEPWRAGKAIQLASGVKLMLVVDGDPAPVRRQNESPPPSHDIDDVADEHDAVEDLAAAADAEAKKKSQRTTRMLVGVLVAMILFNLTADSSSDPDRNLRAEFHDIVNALLEPDVRLAGTSAETSLAEPLTPELAELVAQVPAEELAVFAHIRELLQYARVAQLRGDGDRCLSNYQEARDLLLSLGAGRSENPAAGPTKPTHIYDVVYGFVVVQIESISL